MSFAVLLQFVSDTKILSFIAELPTPKVWRIKKGNNASCLQKDFLHCGMRENLTKKCIHAMQEACKSLCNNHVSLIACEKYLCLQASNKT